MPYGRYIAARSMAMILVVCHSASLRPYSLDVGTGGAARRGCVVYDVPAVYLSLEV